MHQGGPGGTSRRRRGIFDHIGGGFSRYSTGEKWPVPHFEKMLYDNALLILAYLKAFQPTQNRQLVFLAGKIKDYPAEF